MINWATWSNCKGAGDLIKLRESIPQWRTEIVLHHCLVISEPITHKVQHNKDESKREQPPTRICGHGRVCTGIMEKDAELWIILGREVVLRPTGGWRYPLNLPDTTKLAGQTGLHLPERLWTFMRIPSQPTRDTAARKTISVKEANYQSAHHNMVRRKSQLMNIERKKPPTLSRPP